MVIYTLFHKVRRVRQKANLADKCLLLVVSCCLVFLFVTSIKWHSHSQANTFTWYLKPETWRVHVCACLLVTEWVCMLCCMVYVSLSLSLSLSFLSSSSLHRCFGISHVSSFDQDKGLKDSEWKGEKKILKRFSMSPWAIEWVCLSLL